MRHSERWRVIRRLARQLSKLSELADDHDVLLDNGSQVGALLICIANDLINQTEGGKHNV